MVDLDRGAARRRHERLYGLAAKAGAAVRTGLSARPWRGGARRARFVQSYIRHREGREASILRRLGKSEADIPTLVRAVYIGLDPRLVGAASLSALAHLEDFVARGIVATEGRPRSAALTAWRKCPCRPPEAISHVSFRVYLPSRPFRLLRFFRRLGAGAPACRRLFDQRAHARGILAEIVPAVTRGRTIVDAGAVRGGAERTATSSRRPRIGVRAIASM